MSTRPSQVPSRLSLLNHRQLAVDYQQHAVEFVAAAQDQPARRDHAALWCADGRRLSLSGRHPRRPRGWIRAYAGAYRPRPAYRFTVENSVYLEPAIHRRGIGLQLLQGLIAESEARGYRQMIAVIGDSANAGSIGVHARTGFQMIGTHPNVGFKFGRWLDTVMMQRALGEGATTLPRTT